MDKRIFRKNEVDGQGSGWIVDLSPGDVVNPDCYWSFRTRKQAVQFAQLVDAGLETSEAVYQVTERQGRPPLYGETMKQTGIRFPQEQIDWLKSQPDGVSETVRQLVDAAMIVDAGA